MRLLFALLVIASVGLSGCAAPLVVGGAATGAAVVHDRRTLGTVVDDQTLELKLSQLLKEEGVATEDSHINITSYNFVVLLSGEVSTNELGLNAREVVSKHHQVKTVHNELVVGPASPMTSRTNDTWITTKSKAKLLTVDVQGFDPTRVKIVTERQVVYLLGLVSREEGDAAANVVRNVRGVQRVVKLFEYI